MASNNTRARREPTGGKSKMVAALLAFFLGVHQFYLGHGGRGIAMLLLTISFVGLIVSGIWALVDFIRYLTMPEEQFDARYNWLRSNPWQMIAAPVTTPQPPRKTNSKDSAAPPPSPR